MPEDNSTSLLRQMGGLTSDMGYLKPVILKSALHRKSSQTMSEFVQQGILLYQNVKIIYLWLHLKGPVLPALLT